MKSLKVKNTSKFKEWLKNLEEGNYNYLFNEKAYTVANLANMLGCSVEVIYGWFKGSLPSSKNLKKIFEAFPNLKYEDLGVIEYEDNVKYPEFSYRLKMLMKEQNKNSRYLEEKHLVTKSTVSQWTTGKHLPSPEFMTKLAKDFNVTVEFLKGTSDVRNVYNVDESILQVLESDSPDAMVEVYDEMIQRKCLDEKYYDLKEFLINPKLLYVMKEEIDRVIQWHIDDTAYSKFENAVNEKDILGQATSYTHACNPFDIACINIHREIDTLLNQYIAKQIEDLGKDNVTLVNRGLLYVENKKKNKKDREENK